MRRFQHINFNRNLWESSSNDNNKNDPNLNSKIATSSINNVHDRRALLAAYPSFEKATITNIVDHLLFANTPRQLLTDEQRRCYQERDIYPSSFEVIDQSNHTIFTSFFLANYRELFVYMSRRLHLNTAILDYNYQRLLKCFNIMTNERIAYGLQKHALTNGDVLPIHEYPIALEFFLQIDLNVFFMKTCSFRGANECLSGHFEGIFCLVQPYASHGMTACQKSYCNFCYPPSNIRYHNQQYQPVVEFCSTQEHTFVSGYRSILNCPVTCQTKQILYVLTCPCGEYDYIGYTSMTLDQRLAYHREHGNRIIHEFIFGVKNIAGIQTQPKSYETLVKDDMLLYKHSARCPAAMQFFIDCNPQYWSFIPMLKHEAEHDNQFYESPNSIPTDSLSHLTTSSRLRSDHEAGCCMNDLPPFPSDNYTFSTRQCAEQFQYFKNKQDYHLPNFNLNLYNAAIVAVLPDKCSTPLYRLLEALFITHAQTKLNTIGHLDSDFKQRIDNNHVRSKIDIITDRGDWSRNLHGRPKHSYG